MKWNRGTDAAEYKREKHTRRVIDRDHSIPRPCNVCGRVVAMCEPDRDGLFDDRERVWCEPCAAEALALLRAAAEPEAKAPCVHDAAKAFLEGPAACKRCGEPVAYDGAVYCGAACCARDEGLLP